MKGKKSEERLLHGRVGRWKAMLEQFSGFPVAAQFFGMPLTLEDSYAEVSTGAHNDFVRILFFTGYTGVVIYLIIFYCLLWKIKIFTI